MISFRKSVVRLAGVFIQGIGQIIIRCQEGLKHGWNRRNMGSKRGFRHKGRSRVIQASTEFPSF